MKILGWVGGGVLVFLTVFMLLTAGWERPPIDSTQSGYRGTGMVDVVNPRTRGADLAAQEAPPSQDPASSEGPRAGDVYQNVQVLGDLSVSEFTRLMQGITNWVSPEEGCAYCHEGGNFASDKPYTKKVSRRMIEMTQHINAQWKDHVAQTGVTCYTCHRGKNVPQYTWYPDQARDSFQGMAGWRDGQNAPDEDVALSSLPGDPFSPYLLEDTDIRVAEGTALPRGQGASIQATEHTYGLMMHMSESLGVNCTYCHNSRAFRNWEQSNPARVSAWHGIRMAREINNDYVDPLTEWLPPKRKDTQGNAQRVNCTTCHQGLPKPLNGAPMVADYPSLVGDAGEQEASAEAGGRESGAEAEVAEVTVE